MLAKVVTPWEYLLASAQQTAFRKPIFPDVLAALQELHAEAKKMAASCLVKVSDDDPDGGLLQSETKSLNLQEPALTDLLGIDIGWYRAKDPPDSELPKICRLLKKQTMTSSTEARGHSGQRSEVGGKVGEILRRKRKPETSGEDRVSIFHRKV